MQDDRFVWNNQKSKTNFQKHGVSFYEAKTVFSDEFVVLFPDDEHSQNEERFIAIGEGGKQRLLMVCYCERENADVIRIISARKAEKPEIEIYYGGLI